MFIQTEETPNPNTLKFIPGVQVLEQGTVEFQDKESAKISNLANIIFLIDGIERVFLATEFVSVTKNNHTDNACRQTSKKLTNKIICTKGLVNCENN